jgi:hypothetical protein
LNTVQKPIVPSPSISMQPVPTPPTGMPFEGGASEE